MTVYSYSAAKKRLATVLKRASAEGEVWIQHQNGQRFVVKLESPGHSPLDVVGIEVPISAEEIVACVREGREREREWWAN